MSDLSAFYCGTVLAIVYAPWYVAVAFGLALAWCIVMELP